MYNRWAKGASTTKQTSQCYIYHYAEILHKMKNEVRKERIQNLNFIRDPRFDPLGQTPISAGIVGTADNSVSGSLSILQCSAYGMHVGMYQ